MGEGGCIVTSNKVLSRTLRSLRDWGRDCQCYGKETVGLKNGVCGKRFSKWLPGLDTIVDHKYVYSEIGYNLKPLELQCAVGLEQLGKLSDFISRRNANFRRYYALLKDYEDYFILPSWHKNADPAWFAFPLTVRSNAPFDRFAVMNYLESCRIQTRTLFAGNVLYHPAYKGIRHKKCGVLRNTDVVSTNSFFIGVYPGIDQVKMDYILDKLEDFLKKV
jgi:CDP-6-deoxy-D-xylo-4-hexulose-3-dehydrase